MRAFLAIIRKELLEFLRSYGLLIVVLYAFTLDVYIAGNGINLDARNVGVGIIDYSPGFISNKILSHLHYPQFQEPVFFASQEKLNLAIRNKEIMVGIVFESDFEKRYHTGNNPVLNLLLDSTASTQSYLALNYIQHILMRFQDTLSLAPIEIQIHKLFNPNTSYSYFMALSELLSIITILAVILTAAVFVKEKENGTWDIMLLMPTDAKAVILAKSLSQVIIVMVGTFVCVGTVLFGIFDLPINGSLAAFMLLTFFYAFTSAGIGLFIASVARNIMQVAQLSVLIMMPLLFLSGAWTPVYAMHPILECLSIISPLRYYIQGSESVFFRGTALIDLWEYFAGVIVLGGVLFWYGFRKIGKLF